MGRLAPASDLLCDVRHFLRRFPVGARWDYLQCGPSEHRQAAPDIIFRFHLGDQCFPVGHHDVSAAFRLLGGTERLQVRLFARRFRLYFGFALLRLVVQSPFAGLVPGASRLRGCHDDERQHLDCQIDIPQALFGKRGGAECDDCGDSFRHRPFHRGRDFVGRFLALAFRD